MINLPAKFEVSMLTCYKDTKGNVKCRKRLMVKNVVPHRGVLAGSSSPFLSLLVDKPPKSVMHG